MAPSGVPERDRIFTGNLISYPNESQVKEGGETGMETNQEVKLEEPCDVSERDGKLMGNYSSVPVKSQVEEGGEVAREADQVEEAEEPSKG